MKICSKRFNKNVTRVVRDDANELTVLLVKCTG